MAAPTDDSESNRVPSQAEVDQAIEKAFAGRTNHTEEELKIIAFVEEYLVTSQTPFPKPRKHIVSRRADGWDVTLIDVAALRRGDRPLDLTVHLNEVDGRLKVVEGTIR